MLFHSSHFLFVFLPLTLLGFHILRRTLSRSWVLGWLFVASLVFYGWWNPIYLPLILGSLIVNYLAIVGLGRTRSGRKRRLILGTAIALDLCSIGYFKYAAFLALNANAVLGTRFLAPGILLPLGISFFTFQQIAAVLDVYRGRTRIRSALEYGLFITFFPQLIAGPIVLSEDLIPQFARPKHDLAQDQFTPGLAMFLLGLFKKVLVADSLAVYATRVFQAVDQGHSPGLYEAWAGALAYTLQLYFDFSGYSDMAIGLGRMFGMSIPLNFNSPYKATSIIDFWRRWHITLSHFLRDYLYVPLGGNRRGPVRRYLNLLVTMLLGGLWHGAGWTFVAWGGLHGLYLILNHAWIGLRSRYLEALRLPSLLSQGMARSITFLAVVAAWVLFRATSFTSALCILRGMAGQNGVEFTRQTTGPLRPVDTLLRSMEIKVTGLHAFEGMGYLLIVPLLLLCWFAPNASELCARCETWARPGSAEGSVGWRPRFAMGLAFGVGFFFVMKSYASAAMSEFLYFNF